MLSNSVKDKLLQTSRRCFLKNFLLLFLLVFFDGVKDSTARGLPTEGRRRLYQTTADPIPHPDAVSLKKSETTNLLRNKLRFYNVLTSWPTKSATPQRPFEESAVKKSNTEGRPVERKQNLNLFLDSRPNADHDKANNSSEENSIVSGTLQDEDQLSFGQGNMRSKINKMRTYQEGVLRRKQTPIMPSDDSDGELLAAKAGVFKNRKATRRALSLPHSESAFSRDFLESKTEVYRQGQTSLDSIPHPLPENNVGESLGTKRALIFSDDTAKILERKTLLYSEPFYRPTGSLEKNEHLDPRRLISILGDPLPVYKRSDFADQKGVKMVRAGAESRREPHSKGRVRRAHHRKAHFRPHRQEFLDSKKENWDQDEEDIGQTMDVSGVERMRSPNEYSMLERLINDNTISFGTKQEQLDKESTIKEVESLSAQSTRPYSDEHLMGLPDDLSTMEVSEGELPPYDKLPGQHVGLDIRRNHISREMEQKRRAPLNEISSQVGDDRVKTENEADSSARPRLRRKKKRSLLHHFHHHHHWRSPYFHVRSQEFSPYYDYKDEHDSIEFIPKITRFMDFPRFPIPRRLPKFPMSLMSERFVPYPRLPKIAEYSPPQLETLEHYPERPSIPTAISEHEKAGTREEEPVDEWAPLPEPVPAPEPLPIPEPPPIPELAPIKEIPPIKERQEKTPPNLDPKKTFDTGESNGGVKKSS